MNRSAPPVERPENSAFPREDSLHSRSTSNLNRVVASWAQERLWFIDQLDKGSRAYNIPLVLKIRGNLDIDALRRTLNDLIQRHEVLRTVFVHEAGGPQQEIFPLRRFTLQVIDLTEHEASGLTDELTRQRVSEAEADFDLRKGPLIRGRLLQLPGRDHLLLITLHHIVADGWSLGVLFREFAELYAAQVERRASRLEPPSVQYADYARWQRQEFQGQALEDEIRY